MPEYNPVGSTLKLPFYRPSAERRTPEGRAVLSPESRARIRAATTAVFAAFQERNR